MNWHARQTEINTGDTYSSTIYRMGISFQKLKDIHNINRRAGQTEKKQQASIFKNTHRMGISVQKTYRYTSYEGHANKLRKIRDPYS